MIKYELYFKGNEEDLYNIIKKFCSRVGLVIKRETIAFQSLPPDKQQFFRELYLNYAKFKVERSDIHDITGELILLNAEKVNNILSKNYLEYLIGVSNIELITKFVFILLRVAENEWYGCYTTKKHEKILRYLNTLKELGISCKILPLPTATA